MSLLALSLLLFGTVSDDGRGDADDRFTAPLAVERFSYRYARHLLLRAGFGGTPSEIRALQRLGIDAAIDRLVDYELLPADGGHGVSPLTLPDAEMIRRLSEEERQRVGQRLRREDRRRFEQLRVWWMERMLTTERPLEERMALLWHQQFATSYRRVRSAHLMAVQNDLLRRHATGSYRDLVGGMCRDPATLLSFGNVRSHKRKLDERFARAVLRRFALGAGAFGDADVRAAARAFTGWTVSSKTGRFAHDATAHDFGVKEFLGARGNFNGDAIIRLALAHEAAPRLVARAILRCFAVEPTDAEVEPYAKLLRAHDWRIKPMLRVLFASKWFYGDRVLGGQVRSPVGLMVSTLRAMGVRGVADARLVRLCAGAGQDLMQPPNDGWVGGADWLAPRRLAARANIARRLITLRLEPGGKPARGGASSKGRGGTGRGVVRDASGGPQRAFSALAMVREAGVETPAAVVALLERRFLAVKLRDKTRVALTSFLAGADDTPALDLDQGRQAERKLDEALVRLLATPEASRF